MEWFRLDAVRGFAARWFCEGDWGWLELVRWYCSWLVDPVDRWEVGFSLVGTVNGQWAPEWVSVGRGAAVAAMMS